MFYGVNIDVFGVYIVDERQSFFSGSKSPLLSFFFEFERNRNIHNFMINFIILIDRQSNNNNILFYIYNFDKW